MKTKKTKLKPIDIDVYLKYRCPNSDCNIDHWLSLKETKTKNFKVVCDCGTVFKPKKIAKLNIVYDNKHTTTPIVESTKVVVKDHEQEKSSIPQDLLEKASKILSIYGFTDKESSEMVSEAYRQTQQTDIGILIKFILSSFGATNV